MYKCQKLNSNEFHPEITRNQKINYSWIFSNLQSMASSLDCISLMGALIPLNQKKIENSMLFHCVRSPTDNKVTLTQDNREFRSRSYQFAKGDFLTQNWVDMVLGKACVSATGEVYAVGESWNDGHIFYLCDTNAMGDSFVMKGIFKN